MLPNKTQKPVSFYQLLYKNSHKCTENINLKKTKISYHLSYPRASELRSSSSNACFHNLRRSCNCRQSAEACQCLLVLAFPVFRKVYLIPLGEFFFLLLAFFFPFFFLLSFSAASVLIYLSVYVSVAFSRAVLLCEGGFSAGELLLAIIASYD